MSENPIKLTDVASGVDNKLKQMMELTLALRRRYDVLDRVRAAKEKGKLVVNLSINLGGTSNFPLEISDHLRAKFLEMALEEINAKAEADYNEIKRIGGDI